MARQAFILLAIIFLFLWQQSKGQLANYTIDTIEIFKNRTGIGYRIYQREWFPREGGFGYNGAKVNGQDSLIVEPNSKVRHYFKVYNSNNKLILEGQQGKYGTELTGDVKFYRKNNCIKKIEHWEPYHSKDTSGYLITRSDGPTLTWRNVYRRNGNFKRRVEYVAKINSFTPLSYCFIKQTIFYNRHGRIRTIRNKTDECYSEK